MMYSVSYRQMMSHDASAYQAEASSSCAYHTTDTAAMHLDAIIVASIIICALVAVRLSVSVSVVVSVLVLAGLYTPIMRTRT